MGNISGKRKSSESSSSGSSAASGTNPSGESNGSTDEAEDDEESSSSSLPCRTIWSVVKGPTTSGSKRVKLDPSSAGLKEYGTINQDQLVLATSLAAAKGGECISRVTMGKGDTLAFKCRFGHIFRSTAAEVATRWCPTCDRYFAQCLDFAARNRGTLSDQSLSMPVHFECSRGHRFVCKSYRA